MAFDLHPRLDADTHLIRDWSLSRVLLMDDKRFPWVILVPRREDVREWHALDQKDQVQLLTEVNRVAAALEREFKAQKMNIGALGNIVPQLHIHVIARHSGDDAWPGPVWGQGERIPYEDEAEEMLTRLRNQLG